MVIDRNKHNIYVATGFQPTQQTTVGNAQQSSSSDTTGSSSSGSTGSSSTIVINGGGGMTSAQEEKLSGIEAGAQVNQNAYSNITILNGTVEAGTITAQVETDTAKISTITPLVCNLIDGVIQLTFDDTNYATKQYVIDSIDDLIGAAPGALDTLEELAQALGDDPNFATTVTNMIASVTSRVDTIEDTYAKLTDITIANITDLNSNWDSLLLNTPTDYITRWPNWGEVTDKPTWIGDTKPTYTAEEIGALTQTAADGLYVSIAGDTMQGSLTFQTSTEAYHKTGLLFNNDTSRIGCSTAGGIGVYAADGIYLRPNWVENGTMYGVVLKSNTFTYNGYPILTSENYGQYIDIDIGTISPYIVGGRKQANHGTMSTAYTPDQFSANFVNKNFAAYAERGSWSYANNGYVSTNIGVNVPLAGTAVLQWGASDANKTQLFITPGDQVGVSSPAVNEMLFYTSNGSNYSANWTRVLTHRNYSSILDSRYVNISGDTMTGNLTVPSVYTASWFRSTGASGWYSETYGGGIYMTDSYYVRTFNGKALHSTNTQYYAINSAGGFYSGWNNNYTLTEANVLNPSYASFNKPQMTVSDNNTVQPILAWSNLVNGHGYITRYSISSIRRHGWGEMAFCVGDNDAGTSIGAYVGITGAGNIFTDCTLIVNAKSSQSNYNQGIRINRTSAANWATLTIGYVGDRASIGTSANTWLIGTPSNSNGLLFCNNGATTTSGLFLAGQGNSDMKWNNNVVINAANIGSYNAGSATRLQTARTITLTGAVTGSTTFNGAANVTLATTMSAAASMSWKTHRVAQNLQMYLYNGQTQLLYKTISGTQYVYLPTLTEVRNTLGISASTDFAVQFIVHVLPQSTGTFRVTGRTSTVAGHNTAEYPEIRRGSGEVVGYLDIGSSGTEVYTLYYDSVSGYVAQIWVFLT